MRKLCLILFLALFTISFVYAQEDVAGLNKIDTITFNGTTQASIKEGNALKILYNDKEHIIKATALSEDENAAQLTIFIAGAETPFYTTIRDGLTVRMDFERDNIIDVILRFVSIEDNTLNLVIESVAINGSSKTEDVKENQPAEDTKEGNNKGSYNIYIGIAILLIIIIIGVTLYLLSNKKSRENSQ